MPKASAQMLKQMVEEGDVSRILLKYAERVALIAVEEEGVREAVLTKLRGLKLKQLGDIDL